MAAIAAALAAASEAVSLAAEEPVGGAGDEVEGASAHRERRSASILTVNVECKCKRAERTSNRDGGVAIKTTSGVVVVRFGGTGSNCKRWRLGNPA